MAEQNNGTAPQVPETTTLYAVVQTGYVSPSAEIVAFTNDDGSRLPQIVALFNDEESANSRKARLTYSIGKVSKFTNDKLKKSTPLFSVVTVVVIGKRKGRAWTPEQKKAAAERLKKARVAAGKK